MIASRKKFYEPWTDDVNRFQIENKKWAVETVSKAKGVDWILLSRYKKTVKKSGWLVANRELTESVGRLRFSGKYSAAMSDEQINELAELKARECELIRSKVLSDSDLTECAFILKNFAESNSLEWPVKIGKKDNSEKINQKNIEGINRVCDNKFWRRGIRRECIRAVESELISTGEVGKIGCPYVSNWALARVRGRNRTNKEMLSELEIENNNGEVCDLIDVIESSIANPENRLAELMIRMKGFEQYATEYSHKCLFFTLTCPSRFHAWNSATKEKNKKYCGATPKESMDYLNAVWQLIRAKWAKAGLRVYGLRVAEPHKDGTPHLHFSLFVDCENIADVVTIFEKEAMKDSFNEPGAKKHRWSVVEIDPSKGSAVGYLAKYLSKGINGKVELDLDSGGDGEGFTGVDGSEGCDRVRAWASVWGIRQFQQIGAPGVGVWRELRRTKGNCDLFEGVEVDPVIREGAVLSDKSDWCGYLELQGGPFAGKLQRIKPLTVELDGGNKYGGVLKKVVGVCCGSGIKKLLVTRLLVWVVKQKIVEGVKNGNVIFVRHFNYGCDDGGEYYDCKSKDGQVNRYYKTEGC